MTASPRIVGIMLARDQWPLVGVSALHVLDHVDHLVVVDHASTDASATGLAALRDRHPDRITLFRSEADGFLQAAMVAVAQAMCADQDFDWIYVIDADEILLTSAGWSLRDVLARVPQEFDVVRYQVRNWIAPGDLIDPEPGDLLRVRYRATPSLPLGYSGDLLHHELVVGNLTMFDLAFDTKVLVRSAIDATLAAGAHGLEIPRPGKTFEVPPDELVVAHLPMWSRRQLDRRAAHGRALRSAGFPVAHGWQAQAVADVVADGRGDEFWTRHSIGGDDSVPASLSAVVDERLAAALSAPVEAIAALELPAASLRKLQPSSLSFDQAVSVAERFRRQATEAAHEVGSQLAAVHENEVTALRSELGSARAELERVTAEFGRLGQAHRELAQQFDAVELNRNFVIDQLAATHETWSWRIGAPLRALRARLTRRRRGTR